MGYKFGERVRDTQWCVTADLRDVLNATEPETVRKNARAIRDQGDLLCREVGDWLEEIADIMEEQS